MSPASTTWASAKGNASWAGLYGPQQPGALAHRRRAETGAGAVARPGVERDAHHRDVPVGTRSAVGSRANVARPGEAGLRARIGRADGAVPLGHQSSMAWLTSARSWDRNG